MNLFKSNKNNIFFEDRFVFMQGSTNEIDAGDEYPLEMAETAEDTRRNMTNLVNPESDHFEQESPDQESDHTESVDKTQEGLDPRKAKNLTREVEAMEKTGKNLDREIGGTDKKIDAARKKEADPVQTKTIYPDAGFASSKEYKEKKKEIDETPKEDIEKMAREEAEKIVKYVVKYTREWAKKDGVELADLKADSEIEKALSKCGENGKKFRYILFKNKEQTLREAVFPIIADSEIREDEAIKKILTILEKDKGFLDRLKSDKTKTDKGLSDDLTFDFIALLLL